MKKTLVLAAALALSVMTAPVAVAQSTEPADCAAAVAALSAADAAHRAAVDADKAAADAKAADQALRRAEDKLNDAQEKVRIARDDLAQKQARLDDLQKPGDGPDEDDVPSPGETVGSEQQIKDAKAARDAAQKVLDDAESARNAAREARDDARVEADKTDAEALQDKANETDAAAVKTALDEARKDFDRLCDGVTTTPPVPDPDVDCNEVSDDEAQRILNLDRSDPNNLDDDNDGVACEEEFVLDDDDDVVVPSGGVATGGGPA